MKKSVVFISAVIFLSGCVGTNQEVVYEKYKPVKESPKHTFENIPLKESGVIKGIVQKVSFDRKWEYELKGIDTSNAKLPYAKFYSKKRVFFVGDEVYAIFKNRLLQEYYILKRSNLKKTSGKKRVKPLKKDILKGKKHQILQIPTTQAIELD